MEIIQNEEIFAFGIVPVVSIRWERLLSDTHLTNLDLLTWQSSNPIHIVLVPKKFHVLTEFVYSSALDRHIVNSVISPDAI